MATQAQGTLLRFTPSGGAQVAVGKLTSVGAIAPDSSVIDVTTLDSASGYREYMQGFRDAGEVTISGFHTAADAGQAALRAAFNTGASGAVEVEFPDGTTVVFTAFVKSYSLGAAEVDGAVGFSAVLRLSGVVVVNLQEGA